MSETATSETATQPTSSAVAGAPDGAPPWQRVVGMALLLAALLGVTYGGSLQNDFVLDDDILVTENPNVTDIDGLYRSWTTTEQLDYWPLTYSSLWLEWRAFGLDPTGYHVVSLLLQLLSSLLLWLVLLRLKIPGAAVVALLFAVHPVNVESVAWVVQRKNTLAMVFFLLAVWAYVRDGAEGTRDGTLAALVFFVAALLAKTSVVMLPVVLVAATWWQRGRLTRRDLVRAAPFFVVALGFGLLTLWFQHHRVIGWNLVRSDSLLSRIIGATWAVWFYLGKALAPLDLKVVVPRWELDPGAPLHYAPGLLLAAASALLVWKRRTWGRAPLFALVVFVAGLVPVLGLATIHFMKLSLVADHWQYFSLPAVLALVVGVAAWTARRLDQERGQGPRAQRVAVALAVVALAACVVQSRRHARVFDGKEAFGRAATRGAPGSAPAWYMLGATLERAGERDEAKACFAKGLAASASQIHRARFEPHLYGDHAFLLLAAGKDAEAESYFQKAMAAMPSDGKSRFELGRMRERAGDTEGALQLFKASVAARPRVAESRVKLGYLHAVAGRTEDAVRELETAVQLKDRDARTHAMLGVLLAELGRKADAIRHYERALELNPDLPDETRERLRKLQATP